MHTVFGLLLLCVAPFFGAFLGKTILKRRWLSNRWRVFLASLPFVAFTAWLILSQPWLAIALAIFGFFALREGRAYAIGQGYYSGSVADSYGAYRPRVSAGATWGDVHHRDRNVIPWSKKNDLQEMQEGALGSIGSISGRRFDDYPPVIHGQRPRHARLVVDNGHFPPRGASAKRGRLKSVK